MSDRPDIWLKRVLVFLPLQERIQCRQVCTEWKDIIDGSYHQIHRIIIDSKWIPEANESYESKAIEDGLSLDIHALRSGLPNRLIFRCGRYLATIDDQRQDGASAVTAAAISCCNLQKVVIPVSTHLQGQRLNMLLRANTKLKHLSIILLAPESVSFLEDVPVQRALEELSMIKPTTGEPHDKLRVFVKKIVEDAPLLTSFECDQFDDDLLHVVGHKLTLKRLIIESDFSYVMKSSMLEISRLSNLQVLRIDSGDTIHENHWIDEYIIYRIVENCQELKEIELADSATMNDTCLLMLSYLPKLESLAIIWMPQITDKYIPRFSQVKSLTLQKCNVRNRGVMKLLEAPNCLRELDLCGTRITEKTLFAANWMISDSESDEQLTVIIDSPKFDYLSLEGKSSRLDIIKRSYC